MGNNKLEGVGPLPLSMVSSKRTESAIDGFIEGRQGGNRELEHVGPLPLSMVSSKGAGGTIDGFIEGRQGGREQGTPHAQRDMHGISPAILPPRRSGEYSILSQAVRFFFELVNRKEERIAITQRNEERQPNPRAARQRLQANRQI